MKLTARGWGRDMGSRMILDIDITSIEKVPIEDNNVYMHHQKMKIIGREIEISWGGSLRVSKNAKYMFHLELSRDEILSMFLKIFGTSFSRESLKRLGISLSQIAPTEEEVTDAVQNM